MFGKTQTTAFAWFDPAPTRNPRNPAHTPGGSSSGSAAAVAAGVVPMALGTQTMGSIIRPASFCGVTGFKPTFGALPADGVLPFAPSLDTVGLLAESAALCARVWSALGLATQVDTPLKFAVPVGLPSVSPEMDRAFDDAVRRLRTVWAVETIDLPEPYADILSSARMVNDFEGARSHHERWREFGDRIGEKLATLVARGIQISEEEHREKLHYIRAAGGAVSEIFEEFPVLLTPAAPGAAPEGLATTGDPVMNAVWTALGTPAVTVPMPLTGGLPLGLQLIAAPHSDFMLLKAASAVEELFARA
jgi:Asp-tRNA(Asn)/Glu-tRNA(Gln) amidotransferase A subunit family amidase